jgi:bleomycin hydrolase
MMKTIFDVLSCSMGTPPKPDVDFTWETYDRDGKVLKIVTTPKAFYTKYTGPYRPSECFSLINDPRNEYEKLYTVNRLGNVSGGLPIRCESVSSRGGGVSLVLFL